MSGAAQFKEICRNLPPTHTDRLGGMKLTFAGSAASKSRTVS